MYHVSYFKASEQSEVVAFMKAHPFIILCAIGKNNFPEATHIPVLLEERNDKLYLLGHVMRKQQHTLAFEENNNVLAIFYGAHSYISASWYETKNIASTWNYQAVHAKGNLRWLNEEALYQLLVNLTNHFEGNIDSTAAVKNMSQDYIANSMKAITGFEIEITELNHVFKLSQNRDKKSYENITTQLKKGNGEQRAVAGEMEKRKDHIFGMD
jgi:transcriptional regulator